MHPRSLAAPFASSAASPLRQTRMTDRFETTLRTDLRPRCLPMPERTEPEPTTWAIRRTDEDERETETVL